MDLSSTRPLLITVDDAQWSDLPSLRFLSYLSRRVADLPDPARGRDQATDRSRVAHSPSSPSSRHVERLLPRALSRDAVASMSASRAAPAEAVVSAIHAPTGGNPFLTGALLDELAVLGRSLADPDYRGRHRRAGSEHGLAGDARTARPRRGQAGRRGGRPRPRQLAVRRRDPRRPRRHRARLRGRGAGRGTCPAARSGAVRFVHPVVREAVHGALGPVERAELHARAARMLQAEHASPSLVATHLAASPKGTLARRCRALPRGSRASRSPPVTRSRPPPTWRMRTTRSRPLLPAPSWGRRCCTRATRTRPSPPARCRRRGRGRPAPCRPCSASAAAAARPSPTGRASLSTSSRRCLRDWPADAERGSPSTPGSAPSGRCCPASGSVPPSTSAVRRPCRPHAGRAHAAGAARPARPLRGDPPRGGRPASPRGRSSDGALFDDTSESFDSMVGWVLALMALISADPGSTAHEEIGRARARVRAHGSPSTTRWSPTPTSSRPGGPRRPDHPRGRGRLRSATGVVHEELSGPMLALRATAAHFGAYVDCERGDYAVATARLDEHAARNRRHAAHHPDALAPRAPRADRPRARRPADAP